MLEGPIPKVNAHYPKDFTPSVNILRKKKYDYREISPNVLTTPSSVDNLFDKISTNQIVTQQTAKIKHQQINYSDFNEPLMQHNRILMPKIKQEMLRNPRITLKQGQQLAQSTQDNLQNMAGTIFKQVTYEQQPLSVEQPFHIAFPVKQPQQIINQTTKKFYSVPKFQRNNVTTRANSSNILPNLKLNDNLHIKKSSNFNGSLMFNPANQKCNITKKNDHRIMNMEGNQINKLKEEVKVIMNKNKIIKQPILVTEQQEPIEHQQYRNISNKTNMNNHNKCIPKLHNKPMNISYKTSLNTLRNIYQNLNKYQLTIKIPGLFTQSIFKHEQCKKQVYDHAHEIYHQLGIQHHNLIIKRYSNCVMMCNNHVCLIWHYTGRRYLGGWQTQYLDEGFKHGLGLQWCPQRYVFYGQYAKNKKHGLGVIKNYNNVIYMGFWNAGHLTKSNNSLKLRKDEYNPQMAHLQQSQQEQVQTRNQYFDMDSF